jgi:nucleoside-triphosphatase THEP1
MIWRYEMIINTENYMVMIFSYSNAEDKVKISKFRDGKYYMNSIEIQNNNVSETLQNMNEDEAEKYIDEIFKIEIGG